LAECLRGCTQAHDPACKEELLLKVESSPPGGTRLSRSALRLEEHKQMLSPEARRLVETVYVGFSEDGWEDEFDLAPHLATWSPLNYGIADHGRYRAALELFEMMRGGICGWVRCTERPC
jgi:hypothetical protein